MRGSDETQAAEESKTVGSGLQEGLKVEIVSAKGLAMPLESRGGVARTGGVCAVPKEALCSDSVLCTTTDPVLDFGAEFDIGKHKLIVDDSLIMVYLSIAPDTLYGPGEVWDQWLLQDAD